MSKLCAMEAIDTLESWSSMATRTGDMSVNSFCDWMNTEHEAGLWALGYTTLEEAMQDFVKNHVG